MINYLDGGAGGNYGGDNPFPLGEDLDNFAVLATAVLETPHDGTWTFGVNVDDGARLRINGLDVIAEEQIGSGPADFLGTVTLPRGLHDVELLFFEHTGGAALELFYAHGTHTTFNAQDFTLLTIAVPEPGTLMLLALAAFWALASRRRRG